MLSRTDRDSLVAVGVVTAAIVGVLGLGYLANGCGSVLPKPDPARQFCYLSAEAKADERVKAECTGFTWDGCPTRPAIMSELRAAQEACP